MDETVIVINNDEALARKGYPPAIACRYFTEGKYAKAVDTCLQYMEQEPNSLSARLIMARSLYHAGETERARDHFLKALKLDSNNLTALKYLGDILFAEGRETIAMTYYRRIFEIDPYNNGLYCPVEKEEPVRTLRLTLKRPSESGAKREKPNQEPAFITETVGDIYREQGYFDLAGEVYRRLLVGKDNNRVADKLREVEKKLNDKEKKYESSH